MNMTRTFSILVASLALVGGVPLLVAATHEPTDVVQVHTQAPLDTDKAISESKLGLQF